MEVFIKGFLGVFLFATITWLSVGVISAEVDSSQARNFMDNAKETIAESHFSPAAVQEATQVAKENGYQLDITLYEKGVGEHTVSNGASGSGAVGDTAKVECAQLSMKYQYSIPILGVRSEHVVRGYVN